MTPTPPPSPRRRAISVVAVCVIALAAVAAAAILVLTRTHHVEHALLRYASTHLKRSIEVRGTLDLNLLSATPTLTATDVRVSNPVWMPPGVAAEIGTLKMVFGLPAPGRDKSILRLEVLSATLHLVRVADGRANWQWRPPSEPRKSRGFLVRSLYMPEARVVLDDARRHVQFEGVVTAGDVSGDSARPPLRIEGSGQLNGRKASFVVDGEPLATASHDRPYAFRFVERSGESQLRGHGQLLQPFNPGMLDAEFAANGRSMRDLYFLAGMHFPQSAPFTLTGRIERRDRESTFRDVTARFGRSDARGKVTLTIVDGRPRFRADLSSRLLRLSDIGRGGANGSAGSKGSAATNGFAADEGSAAGKYSAPSDRGSSAPSAPASSGALLLPDTQVPLDGLRSRDAVIRYRADTVEGRSLSVTAFSTQVTIDQGVLMATRVSGKFRGGRIAGNVKIDVSGRTPRTTLDLTVTDLPLAQFARKGNAPPPFEGRLEGRLKISGSGNSVHEIASSASGRLSMALPNGAMRTSMAEMTAATLRGLGLTLTKSDQETPVRCGVANFRVTDGVLNAERIVIDTEPVLIRGAGNIRLDTEALDLTLRGEPHHRRLLRLRTPVVIAGSLKRPTVRMGGAGAHPVPEEGGTCEPAALAAQVPGG